MVEYLGRGLRAPANFNIHLAYLKSIVIVPTILNILLYFVCQKSVDFYSGTTNEV